MTQGPRGEGLLKYDFQRDLVRPLAESKESPEFKAAMFLAMAELERKLTSLHERLQKLEA